MSDKELVQQLVWTSAKDFEEDRGFFYIEKNVLMLFEDWKTVEQFGNAIRQRAKDLGKKLVFRIYSGYEKNLDAQVITIDWRPMTDEEQIRQLLLDEFEGGNPIYDIVDGRIERITEEIMKIVNG